MQVNIGVGNEKASGMFFHAPYDPASPNIMPTTGAAVLALVASTGSSWAIAGLVSEDGPSWTPFGSNENIRIWDLSVVRTIETEKGSMTVPVISTDIESMKTVFGTDAVVAQAGGFVVNAADGRKNVEESFVLYGKDGDDDLIWTCEHGMVTEIGEVNITPSGALIWTITITGGWKFAKSATVSGGTT